jgi:peptidyl-prolyl cis-trans isomerase A (cyclophilin A)
MDRRSFIASAAALTASPALAQTQEAAPATATPPGPPPAAAETPPAAAPTGPPPLPPTPKGHVRVALTTVHGVIIVELYKDKAPITAGNFLRYVDEGRMSHATFYRASHPPGMTDYGMLQGGLQNDPKYVLKPIAHESTLKTGLSHTDGAISLGRHAPGTATSDFFICVGDQTYLDANPKAKGDNAGFAAFGYVVQGMDVVKKMMALPRSPTAGVGVMKGEMLKTPVAIKARRLG